MAYGSSCAWLLMCGFHVGVESCRGVLIWFVLLDVPPSLWCGEFDTLVVVPPLVCGALCANAFSPWIVWVKARLSPGLGPLLLKAWRSRVWHPQCCLGERTIPSAARRMFAEGCSPLWVSPLWPLVWPNPGCSSAVIGSHCRSWRPAEALAGGSQWPAVL